MYKAPGPDGLPNWLLRDFCAHLAGPVCAIYNASVREGFVPSCWKEANVVPVPKVHPPRDIEADLRPITLTATLGKVLESFVGAWILERVGSTIDDRQYGALKQRSTTHALVDMLHHWHAALSTSLKPLIMSTTTKMVALGLPDAIVQWICAFLRHKRQRVTIGDIIGCSWWRVCRKGLTSAH